MLKPNNKIRLTLKKENGRLIRKAEFSQAKVDVKNRYADNEIFIVLAHSVELSPRVEEEVTQTLTLGWEFIENSLKEPVFSWGKSKSKTKSWTKLPERKRLMFHCEELAADFGGIVLHMEVI